MSTDNFGSLGADFFIKTYNKGSTMSQADLDALVQYVQLTTTILAIGDFTADQQDSVWMILERTDVNTAPGYTVTNNTDVTMTSGGVVTINSLPWSKITGKPTLFSGDYNDLTNKPTIPTTVSSFTNDAGYLTSVSTPTMINSGNTAPGSAVVANETNVSVNFSDGGSGKFVFKANGQLQLASGGDIVDSTGASVLGGGSASTGNITFSGNYMTGTDGTVRMQVLNVNQTASYSFTPGVDYSTAVWDGTGITFNDPTQTIYDAIWALTNFSTIEVQVAGTWFTVTSAGSSTPGMPQAPTLWLNQTAEGGPLNIDIVDIIINEGTSSFVEIDSTDFEVDVQDDIRMYANDTFLLSNRSTSDPIRIETSNGDYRWQFRPDGGLDLPDGGDIYRNGSSVIPSLASVATSGSYNDLNDRPNSLYRQVIAPVISKGQPGDQQNDIAFDNNYVYYCTSDYIDGVAHIWKRIAFSVDTWD